MRLPAILRAIRPQQWVKNVFVLAAVAFARADTSVPHDPEFGDVLRSLYAFAAFCLGASAIYLVNDVLDVESDRAHPTKRHRPIASGEVGVQLALVTSVLCVAGALSLAWLADPIVFAITGGYILLNFSYSVRLKHIVLVDVFCIATGFMLRVQAGAFAAHAEVSHWLVLCTLFLALFLALCKRKAEIDLLGDERGSHRANLMQYTSGFLDQMVTALAACTIVCYTMYTVSEETVAKFGSRNLIYTVPFVVFGLARYLLLVSQQKGGGSPTRVLLGGDSIFVVNALLWVAATGFVVYG